MSKAYCEKNGVLGEATTSPEMREFCKRPGKHDKDGNIIYFTEQGHKKECDINEIIKKFNKTGLFEHVTRFEMKFGDMSGADFYSMQQKIAQAKSSFENLPLDIKKRFKNDPGALLDFMDDPGNRDEAIELGLISRDWTPETDGMGEHNVTGEHDIVPPEGDKTEH